MSDSLRRMLAGEWYLDDDHLRARRHRRRLGARAPHHPRTLGAHARLGGSVVTRDVAPGAVVVGNPARVRQRKTDSRSRSRL
ncbi:acyltransferase [Pimelobacter simplex]|uniref:acyltransferase n=1 Tax=Nocardioides simplex TaxID=2045 RepID=UPI003AAD0FD6